MKTKEIAPFDSEISSYRPERQYSYYKTQQQIIEDRRVWYRVAAVSPVDFHAWLVLLYEQYICTELYPGALQQLQPNLTIFDFHKTS